MMNSSFIHEMAEYIDGRIVKVVLNETHEITNFEVKSTTGGAVALNYIVPVAAVSQLTSLELKDESDFVISSHSVNVPITSDTLMLQTIEVKEVSA